MFSQLNITTVLFQTIQFTVSTVSISKTILFQVIQFSKSTQFSSRSPVVSMDKIDPIKCYHSGPEWTWDLWQ